MKVVLRHKTTGRYYRAPRDWVRRADNALAFDDVASAQEFLAAHHLDQAHAVYRLAPYLMPLLQRTRPSPGDSWWQAEQSGWEIDPKKRFDCN